MCCRQVGLVVPLAAALVAGQAMTPWPTTTKVITTTTMLSNSPDEALGEMTSEPFTTLFVTPLFASDAATTPAAPVETNGELAGTPEELDSESYSKCRHGVWNTATHKCDCYAGWGSAGITDTIDFLEGVCEQYKCVSDDVCKRELGIDSAICPVRGWNCYCGWEWSYYNHLHGYETQVKNDGEGGAECMGFMYTFSIFYSESLKETLTVAWVPFLAVAFLLLPVGKKRSICDHHRPTLWNTLRYCTSCTIECNGACVSPGEYNVDCFKDDIAWSLYVLDLGVWFYLFMVAVLCVVLTIWSVVLWAIVFLVLVAMMLMGLCAICASCAEGGGGGGDCNCGDCCGCCGDGAGNTAAGASGGEAGGECCGMNCCMPSSPGGSSADALYWGGSYPYDPYWGYGGYGHVDVPSTQGGNGGCCNSFWKAICFPIAWLLFVFPAMPENAWGGLLGRCMGTHHFTAETEMYTGDNRFIEFLRMGWRRNADLHSNDSWRRQVFDFLVASPEDGHADPRAGHQIEMTDRSSTRRMQQSRFGTNLAFEPGAYHAVHQDLSVVRIGAHSRALLTDQPFELERDRCYQSSFDDYKENKCWICQSENDQWDLWISCRHLFCSTCSTQMLERRMPCPLCRVASSTVKRGLKWQGEQTGSIVNGNGNASQPTGTALNGNGTAETSRSQD